MSCHCSGDFVRFDVPEDLREHAPRGAETLVVCPTCLELSVPRDGADDGHGFDRIVEGYPEGRAGAAMALAVGLLAKSLTLNRESILALFDAVEEAGADPWLVLERLDAAPRVSPDFSIARARRQLEQLSDA